MSRKQTDDPHIERMATLLRQGSTLTNLACPACSSPLFKLRNGDIWCGKCEKKVIVVKEGEDTTRIVGSIALENLEATLLKKIRELQNKMQNEENVDELMKINATLSGLLENLGKLKEAKRA